MIKRIVFLCLATIECLIWLSMVLYIDRVMGKLYNISRPYLFLFLILVLSTLVAWLPFLLRIQNLFGLEIPNSDMGYIYKNYDGLLYIIAAKTMYVTSAIEKVGLELPFSARYFAAHLPLYPILIRFFQPVLGYIRSMMFVSLASSTLLTWFFYYIVKKLEITKFPFLLSVVFLFLARFLVVRVVGAPEPIFLLLILISLFSFEKKQYFLAGIAGFFAVMTKSPGLLLFFGYGLVLVERYIRTKKVERQSLWIGIIPLGFLAVCLIYAAQYHDFLAYFHSGDNIHLVFPFSVFNFRQSWIGTAWLEDIIFYFFLYGYTVITLYRSKYRSFFYFSLVFFLALINVQHRDIARYGLPLWPMACIALQEHLTKKKFLLLGLILLPALYFYAWNMLAFNIYPVSNWAPFL